MNTPVDIDKLKELQRLLSDGEWWQTVTRGPNPTSFTSDMTHVARQAAALIAKAERVDAMERIMREIEKHATMANNVIRLNRDGGGNGRVKVATCMHHIERLARNALSPKESE